MFPGGMEELTGERLSKGARTRCQCFHNARDKRKGGCGQICESRGLERGAGRVCVKSNHFLSRINIRKSLGISAQWKLRSQRKLFLKALNKKNR